ncbi:MAG TPA: M48 family metallopeptidase [Xanthobacteraceae bacterium]|jgi:Zn-dependent protease with chaperone function|nr:M48 family metallopeptidase [Xanthobacteraceae bacterium]
MVSMSPDFDAGGDVPPPLPAEASAPSPSIYFDGVTNRKHAVTLRFESDHLDIVTNDSGVTAWRYDDVRMVDGVPGTLRLKCVTGLPLARLNVSDAATQAEIRDRTKSLEIDRGSPQTGRIVGWSLAAICSIVLIVAFGVPLVAERMVPLVPMSFERRLGGVVDNQVRLIFGGKTCTDPEGNAAFAKMVEKLREASRLETPLQTVVLATSIPNAVALPGGKIYLLNGLLQKANDPDEIAGVIAHEMGHVAHRDQVRVMIQNGGTSFLIGLLFGDITGSAAAIFAARSLIDASYSRQAEGNADAFAIETMHALGRSPAPMGELLFRVTGAQGNNSIGILASHPLTEERRELMRREDRAATGAEILSATEWRALKNICRGQRAK